MASLSPFFGAKLSGNVVKSIKDLQVHEDECLHLSAACLQQAESGSTEYVLSIVKTGGEPIVVGILNSQTRQVHLDLVVDNTDSLQLKVNGKDTKNAVHVSGFFDVESGDDEASDDGQMELVKPVEDMDDTNASDGQQSDGQQSGSDSDAAEEEEEESDAEVGPVEIPEVQVAAAAAVSSSDEDENEDDSDEQGSGSEQGSDSGSGSDSEEEAPVPEPKKLPAKKQAAPPAKKKQVEEVKKVDQKKRKAETAHPEASPSKKSNNEVDTYVSSVVKFLKARGGVARIGVIGGQCKKPASVKGLTKLFTDRKEFKVSGEEVHLA